jgi:hypothetical protein
MEEFGENGNEHEWVNVKKWYMPWRTQHRLKGQWVTTWERGQLQ